MIVNNLKELEKELKKRIDKALKTEVAEIVEDVMIDHAIQDVYDVYEPKMYQRRYSNGGLVDRENILSIVENGLLIVQNVTTGNPNTSFGRSNNAGELLAPIIESGIGYDFENWDYYGVPRPFIHNTRDDLERNHYHTQALKIGLKEQGLEVK